MRDPPPCGYPVPTGPGSERSWGGREEVSQLLAEMGVKGGASGTEIKGQRAQRQERVTQRGNQALET